MECVKQDEGSVAGSVLCIRTGGAWRKGAVWLDGENVVCRMDKVCRRMEALKLGEGNIGTQRECWRIRVI
jgi:hypothetical protein